MATLTIRRLDDGVCARLRQRALQNKRSLEAEVREILEMQSRDISALVDDLVAFNAEMRAKHGELPDSVDLIREMRNAG